MEDFSERMNVEPSPHYQIFVFLTFVWTVFATVAYMLKHVRDEQAFHFFLTFVGR